MATAKTICSLNRSLALYAEELERAKAEKRITTRPRALVQITENTKEQQMAIRGRPFPKGISGNPGGRPRVLGDVQELARERSPEAINTLAAIMDDKKAPPAARVAAANSLLDRGYGKPTQPISQTLTRIDPSTMSDAELAAIVRNGIQPNARPH
jgi:hypothetical protein